MLAMLGMRAGLVLGLRVVNGRPQPSLHMARRASPLDRAILLVVALRDPQTSRRVVEYARRTNERLGIVARAHTRDAADYLRKAGANEVVLGEEELAIEMTGYALHRLGVSPQEIALIARGLRAR